MCVRYWQTLQNYKAGAFCKRDKKLQWERFSFLCADGSSFMKLSFTSLCIFPSKTVKVRGLWSWHKCTVCRTRIVFAGRCVAVQDTAVTNWGRAESFLQKTTRQHFLFFTSLLLLLLGCRNWQSSLALILVGRKCTLWPWPPSAFTKSSSPSTGESWVAFWTTAVSSCTRPSDATWPPRATRGSTTSSITLPTATSLQLCMGLRKFTGPTCKGSAMASTRC